MDDGEKVFPLLLSQALQTNKTLVDLKEASLFGMPLSC